MVCFRFISWRIKANNVFQEVFQPCVFINAYSVIWPEINYYFYCNTLCFYRVNIWARTWRYKASRTSTDFTFGQGNDDQDAQEEKSPRSSLFKQDVNSYLPIINCIWIEKHKIIIRSIDAFIFNSFLVINYSLINRVQNISNHSCDPYR